MELNISEESYKRLQEILEKEGKIFSLEEVEKIGKDLMEFFDLLMDESDKPDENQLTIRQ